MNRKNDYALEKFLNKEINEEKFREHDNYMGFRTWYQHDIDEIIYSLPFRRLAFKSQLITPVNENGRTRLVHTLDVNRIAVHLTKSFGLCTTLTEAISLGHDLGQTPFGKACSKAFEEIKEELKRTKIVKNDFVLFSHEEFSHEIAEKIGERVVERDSENEDESEYFVALDGSIGKTNKRGIYGKEPFQTKIARSGKKKIIERTLSNHTLNGILLHNKYRPNERPERLEAQVVQIADDFAYIIEDIEDGLKAGLLDINNLKEFKNAIRKKVDNKEELLKANVNLLDICSSRSGKRFDVMIRRTIHHNKERYRNEADEQNINIEYDPVLKDIIESIWTELLPKIHEKISPSFEKAKYEVKFLFNQLLKPESLEKDMSLRAFVNKFNFRTIRDINNLLKIIARYIAYMTDNEFLENVNRYFRRTMYDTETKEPIEKGKLHHVEIDKIGNILNLLNTKG